VTEYTRSFPSRGRLFKEESPIGKENERSEQAGLVVTESTQTKLNVPTKLVHSLPPVKLSYSIFIFSFYQNLLVSRVLD